MSRSLLAPRGAPDASSERMGGKGARLISPLDVESLDACSRLRFRYFVEHRGWVPEDRCPMKKEYDRYDPHSLHLGVWEGDEVAAYLRVLPFIPEVGFMLDHELSAVLSVEDRLALPRDNAVELSRFVCRVGSGTAAQQAPIGQESVHAVDLLFKSLYWLAAERGFTRFYIVVEASWLRPFARRFGLPFKVLGKPYSFPDGTKTVAAVATREELEAGMRAHSQIKYQWWHEGLKLEGERSLNAGP